MLVVPSLATIMQCSGCRCNNIREISEENAVPNYSADEIQAFEVVPECPAEHFDKGARRRMASPGSYFLDEHPEAIHNSRMAQFTGLGKYNIVGFVSIVDVARARDFYRDTLGLRLVMEEPPFALVFEANGIMLRLGMAKELLPSHGTVLGWQVPEIVAAVQNLEQAGVRFERFEGMEQDELGIWNSPTGARVAWFKDPDGNILSISEHPDMNR